MTPRVTVFFPLPTMRSPPSSFGYPVRHFSGLFFLFFLYQCFLFIFSPCAWRVCPGPVENVIASRRVVLLVYYYIYPARHFCGLSVFAFF